MAFRTVFKPAASEKLVSTETVRLAKSRSHKDQWAITRSLQTDKLGSGNGRTAELQKLADEQAAAASHDAHPTTVEVKP